MQKPIMPAPTPVRLVCAAGTSLQASLLAAALACRAEVDCVGCSADVDQVRRWAGDCEVIVLQAGPVADRGLGWVRLLRQERPEVEVVVVGLPKDEGLAVACIEAGALGCVSEDEDTGRLIEAVLAVRQHDGYLAPELAPALLRRLRTLSKTVCDPQAAAARLETLTPRQHEILGLMARGSANGEIAARLVIAPGTVKNHVHNILTKLKARDRWEAVACAEVAARSGALDSLWPLAWLPWPTAPAGEVEGEFDIVERAAVDHPRLGEAGRARPGARSDRWN